MQDRGMTLRSAMSEALMYRLDNTRQVSDDAREFVGLSIPELARRGLELNGISTRAMSAGAVIERALHTTSDFSQVISNVGQTTLQAAYSAVPSELKAVGRKTSLRDFKFKKAVRLSASAISKSETSTVNTSAALSRKVAKAIASARSAKCSA